MVPGNQEEERSECGGTWIGDGSSCYFLMRYFEYFQVLSFLNDSLKNVAQENFFIDFFVNLPLTEPVGV